MYKYKYREHIFKKYNDVCCNDAECMNNAEYILHDKQVTL